VPVPKPPTPARIAGILRRAGYKASRPVRGQDHTEGFRVAAAGDGTVQVRHLYDSGDWASAPEPKRRELWDLCAEWADHYKTLLEAKGYRVRYASNPTPRITVSVREG
jgi:hypothetical protein